MTGSLFFLLSLACSPAATESVAELESGDAQTLENNVSGMESSSPSSDSRSDPVEPGTVTYAFSWTDVSDEWTESGLIQNDLGYTFELEQAQLGVYRIQLVPCETSETLGLFDIFSLMPVAYAGHDDGPPDPSAYSAGLVEGIGRDDAPDIPSVQVDSGTYCGVHLLYAETPEFAAGVEDGMVGLTLLLRGAWRSDWSTGTASFELMTTLGNGVMHEFEEEGMPPQDLSVHGVHVQIVRSMAGLFDGMDPEVMTDDALAKVFLTNLVKNTTIKTEVL